MSTLIPTPATEMELVLIHTVLARIKQAANQSTEPMERILNRALDDAAALTLQQHHERTQK